VGKANASPLYVATPKAYVSPANISPGHQQLIEAVAAKAD
jgi:hypothetical protein